MLHQCGEHSHWVSAFEHLANYVQSGDAMSVGLADDADKSAHKIGVVKNKAEKILRNQEKWLTLHAIAKKDVLPTPTTFFKIDNY